MADAATFEPNGDGMLFEHTTINIKHMKPKKETAGTVNSQSDTNTPSNAPGNKSDGANKEIIINEDEQKKKTNKDNEDEPEQDPDKVPDKQEEPAKDPGDPAINPGEKEKNKEKIPVNHPGNKS